MRRIARPTTNNRSQWRKPQSNYIYSLLAAGTMSIIGALSILPFIWYVAFVGHEPTMSIWRALAVVLLVFGGPMLIIGLIGLVCKRTGGYSTLESDVSRIRFAVETQTMNDLMKGGR